MFKLYVLWAKFVAFLFGGRSVWLQDFEGETYLRTAYEDGFGNWTAKLYPMTIPSGTMMVLHADGSTTGLSYVKKWRWA